MFGYGLRCCPSFAGWCLWCLWLGLGFGLHMGRAWLRARSACPPLFPVPVCGVGVRAGVWVLGCAPPLLGGLLGCVCARAPVPRGLPHLLVGGAVRGCVFVRAPRLFPAFPGWGVLCGRACWARVSAVPRPSWLVCRGFFFFLGVSCFGSVVPVASCPCPGPCGPCPPIPFLSGWVAGSFFFPRGVCLRVVVPLFPVGRCSWLGVAGFGWVVPLCPFGAPVVGTFWMWGLAASCGVGGRFGACGPFSRPPPPFPPVFFSSGGVCLFPPLPSLGCRTHWPAFSVVFRVAVGGCVLLGRVPAPWVGWAMYTLGSAPVPARLGPGSAGWAAAPGGRAGSGLGGWGCPCPFSSAVPVLTFWVVRHRCCQARGGPPCGPRCRCVACCCGAFRGVHWLVSVSPSG